MYRAIDALNTDLCFMLGWVESIRDENSQFLLLLQNTGAK